MGVHYYEAPVGTVFGGGGALSADAVVAGAAAPSPTILATSMPNCSKITTGSEPSFISIRFTSNPLESLSPAWT
jgi:hypothetical protein